MRDPADDRTLELPDYAPAPGLVRGKWDAATQRLADAGYKAPGRPCRVKMDRDVPACWNCRQAGAASGNGNSVVRSDLLRAPVAKSGKCSHHEPA